MSRTRGHAWGGRDPHNDGTHRHTRRLRPAGRTALLFQADLAYDTEVLPDGTTVLHGPQGERMVLRAPQALPTAPGLPEWLREAIGAPGAS
jgi:hypothetical protein